MRSYFPMICLSGLACFLITTHEFALAQELDSDPAAVPKAHAPAAVPQQIRPALPTLDLRNLQISDHVDHPYDRQIYTPENVSVHQDAVGQTLVIQINRIPPRRVTSVMGNGEPVERIAEFASARVIYPIHFTTGRIDVLAKLPLGSGLHPCIWLLRSDESWPPEIDIAEVIGKTSDQTNTVRTNFITGTWDNANYDNSRDVPITRDFQVFSIVVKPDKLTWLIDGQVVRTAKIPPGYLNGTFDLVISGAVGEAWEDEFGSPDTLDSARIEVGQITVRRD